MPFEALARSNRDGTLTFAGQDYTISYAPSATVFAYLRKSISQANLQTSTFQLFALGDPVFDSADSRFLSEVNLRYTPLGAIRSTAVTDYLENVQRIRFARLLGTREEVRQITDVLGVTTDLPHIRFGLDANEHSVKTLDLKAYRYIHFATHGVLAGEVPYLRQPALVLSRSGDMKGEDGFLTMEEVLNLHLLAEVTVLSACQTGLGREVSGEGTVGLMRAFLYAGSRSVVGSLWPVSDNATALLMAAFYQQLSLGLSPPEALKGAGQYLQTQENGRFSHPFYWASFVLYGAQ
jgi:CHAT domain-containing protein